MKLLSSIKLFAVCTAKEFLDSSQYEESLRDFKRQRMAKSEHKKKDCVSLNDRYSS